MAKHITVADQARNAGYDPDPLGNDFGRGGGPREVVPVTVTTAADTTLTGLLYQLDYRAEEEWGCQCLRKAITGEDPRRVKMTRTGRRNAAPFTDVNGFVLSTTPVPVKEYQWGQDLSSGSFDHSRYGTAHPQGWVPDYVSFYTDALGWVRKDSLTRDINNGHATMRELRAAAEKYTVPRPWARTKADLGQQILTSDGHKNRSLPDKWPGWFHYGDHLVIRADTGVAATIVTALRDAIDAGTLAVTTHSFAFASGLFLYDARDETKADQKYRDDQAAWYDTQMAALKPISDQLTKYGHRWYFLGKPQKFTTNDGNTVIKYWLNGWSGATAQDGTTCRRQPHGWYTLDELAAEKFVHDAAEREASA